VVIVWNDGYVGSQLGLARSGGRGATWTALPSPGASGWRPALATDAQGRWVAAYSTWGDIAGATHHGEDVAFILSDDGGLTWSSPAFIDPHGEQQGAWFVPTPRLAFDAAGPLWVAAWPQA